MNRLKNEYVKNVCKCMITWILGIGELMYKWINE